MYISSPPLSCPNLIASSRPLDLFAPINVGNAVLKLDRLNHKEIVYFLRLSPSPEGVNERKSLLLSSKLKELDILNG